jgi:hypothetical protein
VIGRRPSRVAAGLVLASVLLVGAMPRRAAAQRRAAEIDVQAAYLYRFGQFVRWPAAAVADGKPFTICVLEPDPFGPALDATLAHESIGGHTAVARRIARVADASGCQMLFLTDHWSSQLGEVLGPLAHSPILTVSDMPDFTARGGMIQFVSRDNRVRFEINLAAIDAAGLTASSELARVALAVRQTAPEER